MNFIPPRTGIVVSFIPCTNTRPYRYRVRIRDFPDRVYSAHSAPDHMGYMEIPQWFAEKRLGELNLTGWEIRGAAFIENVGFVFTL